VQDTDSDSDNDGEDSCSNRMSALFEHDTEMLSVGWRQSENVRWRMEIPLDSLADRVLVVSKEGLTVNLFLFLANQPKIYRGKPRQARDKTEFHRRLLDSVPVPETVWERESCFERCDRRTFGSCNVLHLTLATVNGQNLSSLFRRLELTDFAVCYGSPTITDVKSSGNIPRPKFQTFDASYAWFCLLSRGFKVCDQARSKELLQLVNNSADSPQLGSVLEAVAARVDEWLICDLKRAFVEELECARVFFIIYLICLTCNMRTCTAVNAHMQSSEIHSGPIHNTVA